MPRVVKSSRKERAQLGQEVVQGVAVRMAQHIGEEWHACASGAMGTHMSVEGGIRDRNNLPLTVNFRGGGTPRELKLLGYLCFSAFLKTRGVWEDSPFHSLLI